MSTKGPCSLTLTPFVFDKTLRVATNVMMKENWDIDNRNDYASALVLLSR